MRARLVGLVACMSAAAACGTSSDGGLSTGPLADGGFAADSSVLGRDAGVVGVPNTPAPVTPGTGAGGGDKCLVQPVDVKGQAPDMLIVMDRSLSMLAMRWAPSVQAVNTLVNQYQSSVDFGLSLFPSNTDLAGCGAATLDVPVAPMNAQAVSAALGGTVPFGVTPTSQALAAALGFLGPRMAAGPDVAASKPANVLLVTDGDPSCGIDPEQETINAAGALRAAGIPVYVVGYNVGGSANVMNAIAQAGGTERYYAVESPQDLDTAFRAITKDVVRCDFDLATTTNPDPKFVYITIDGQEVPLSDVDGWKVEGRRITLNGAACETLKDGAIHAVSAEIRCEPLR
jgi:von Willebrand factor type A domain